MLNQIKAYAIAIGSILLTILTAGAYARYQKRRTDKLVESNKRLQIASKHFQKAIQDYEQRNKQEKRAHRLDDDAIHQQLHNNGNLRD
ncbi:MAG: DUF2681 domain-containing protein [Gammaproteobacteria bacterium]|nr:DUF2681 domain-containing protein [Gammaproteobacteria bacterium]